MNTTSAETLRSKGISPSVQRIAIYDYLMEHSTHPTVDEIYKDLSPIIPTLSKTTIYNTLTLFQEHGLIDSFTIDDNNTHYDGDMRPHAHFKCTKCGKIYDITLPKIEAPKLDGFEINEMKVFYYGICESCKNGVPVSTGSTGQQLND